MKFCVFGAGRMGARHIANIAASERAELAYIVDPDQVRAAALAERYDAVATDDPGRALSDPTVDAVVIASATNTHVDLIIASARAGKAILCEKPIDLDMARVEACSQAIRGCEVPIMIGFQRRFDTTHRAVKSAIERGEVGEPEVITIISRDPGPPPPAYIKVSGGQFHDQMIHDFDLALWLSGATGRVELVAMASNLVDPEIGRLGDSTPPKCSCAPERRVLPDRLQSPRRLWLRPAGGGVRIEGHGLLGQCSAQHHRALLCVDDSSARYASARLHAALPAFLCARARCFHRRRRRWHTDRIRFRKRTARSFAG